MEQFEGKNILNFVKELPNDDNIWQNINGKIIFNLVNTKVTKVV